MDLFIAVPRPQKLDSCNPKLLQILELELFESNGERFIGKKVPSYPNIEELTNLESHLSSILKRLQLEKAEARLVGLVTF